MKHTKAEELTAAIEAEQLISECIDFFNFERISLKNSLAPVEIGIKAA